MDPRVKAAVVGAIISGFFGFILVIAGVLIPPMLMRPTATLFVPPTVILGSDTPTPDQPVSSTPTSSLTPTSTNPLTPSPTTIPDAIANQSTSIFAAPNACSPQLDVLSVGDSVTVLGRSSAGSWLYVQSSSLVEGFASSSRFDWGGHFDSLPIIQATVTSRQTCTPTPTPTPSLPPPPFTFVDLHVFAVCTGVSNYRAEYTITVAGGAPPYIYWLDTEQIGGPTNDVTLFHTVERDGGRFVGTFHVDDNAGQRVSMVFSTESPCDS